MIDIIQNNPFRILGVYADASAAEIKRNETKIRRFLEVNKPVTFPTDELGNLPAPVRTGESLDKALSSINLSKEKLYYALFWYSQDESSQIINGGVEELLRDDYQSAAASYFTFIHGSLRSSSLASIVESTGLSDTEIAQLFLDGLYTIVQRKDYLNICSYVFSASELDYAKGLVISRPLANINAAINTAKNADKSTPAKSLQVGRKLISDSKPLLQELRNLLGINDSQYHLAADSLAKQILQCGINYYNESDDSDKIEKALELQEYALSIAAGKLTKDRCQQNVDILHKHKGQAGAEDDIAAIVKLLQGLDSRPERMSSASDFVDECIPYLSKLKVAMGASDELYIKISSAIVNNALGFAIKLVNRDTSSKSLAESAMALIRKIETLDMDAATQQRVMENKSTLLLNIIRMPSGFERANNATGGCLGTLLSYLVWAAILGAIAGLAQLCS